MTSPVGVTGALAPMRALVPIVTRNNPHKPLTWVLARADVSATVKAARVKLLASGTASITGAYQRSFEAARLAATAQLAGLGIEPDWSPAPDSVYLAQLVDRWQESAAAVFQSLYGKMTQAVAAVQLRPTLHQDPVHGVASPFQALGQDKQAALEAVLDAGIRALTFRAGVGASSAAAKAAGEALEALVPPPTDNQRLLKRWHISGLPGTCIYCRQLDGVTVPVGADFPVVGLLPVFGGVLSGPPRHPNCRCYLELLLEDLATHAAGQLTLPFPPADPAAPSSPPTLTPPPAPVDVSISAAQIRAMPRKTYNSVVASLLAVIRRFLGRSWKAGRKWLGF